MTRHKMFFTVEPTESQVPFQLVLTGYLETAVGAPILKDRLPALIEELGGVEVEAIIVNVGPAPWTVDTGGSTGE